MADKGAPEEAGREGEGSTPPTQWGAGQVESPRQARLGQDRTGQGAFSSALGLMASCGLTLPLEDPWLGEGL